MRVARSAHCRVAAGVLSGTAAGAGRMTPCALRAALVPPLLLLLRLLLPALRVLLLHAVLPPRWLAVLPQGPRRWLLLRLLLLPGRRWCLLRLLLLRLAEGTVYQHGIVAQAASKGGLEWLLPGQTY